MCLFDQVIKTLQATVAAKDAEIELLRKQLQDKDKLLREKEKQLSRLQEGIDNPFHLPRWGELRCWLQQTFVNAHLAGWWEQGYDFNACNSVTYILYNTDIISSVVKLIVHGPVGKLV